MLKFDIEDLNPGTWFFDNGKDKTDGGICVRQLSGEASSEINKKTISKKFEFVRGRRVEVQDVDHEKVRDLTTLYCFVDGVVFDKSGNQIEMTDKNKLKLINESPSFMRYYTECLNAVVDAEYDHQEDLEKN